MYFVTCQYSFTCLLSNVLFHMVSYILIWYRGITQFKSTLVTGLYWLCLLYCFTSLLCSFKRMAHSIIIIVSDLFYWFRTIIFSYLGKGIIDFVNMFLYEAWLWYEHGMKMPSYVVSVVWRAHLHCIFLHYVLILFSLYVLGIRTWHGYAYHLLLVYYVNLLHICYFHINVNYSHNFINLCI